MPAEVPLSLHSARPITPNLCGGSCGGEGVGSIVSLSIRTLVAAPRHPRRGFLSLSLSLLPGICKEFRSRGSKQYPAEYRRGWRRYWD